MKLGKKALSFFGVMALSFTSLTAGGSVAAQQIETSITVENTACVDETLTSFSFTPDTTLSFARDVKSPAGIQTNRSLSLSMYVNACLKQEWSVTARMTQFTAGSYTLPAAAYRIAGDSYYAGNVINGFGFQVVGTNGLPWGAQYPFNVASGDLWTISRPVSTGSAATSGQMYQYLSTGVDVTQIPNTTQGNLTYQATMTLTFASTGP
jgi:hypothetical protein